MGYTLAILKGKGFLITDPEAISECLRSDFMDDETYNCTIIVEPMGSKYMYFTNYNMKNFIPYEHKNHESKNTQDNCEISSGYYCIRSEDNYDKQKELEKLMKHATVSERGFIDKYKDKMTFGRYILSLWN